jgi:hypothetical protein
MSSVEGVDVRTAQPVASLLQAPAQAAVEAVAAWRPEGMAACLAQVQTLGGALGQVTAAVVGLERAAVANLPLDPAVTAHLGRVVAGLRQVVDIAVEGEPLVADLRRREQQHHDQWDGDLDQRDGQQE